MVPHVPQRGSALRERVGLGLLSLITWLVSAGCETADDKTYEPRTRTYYVAAEAVRWDYAPSQEDTLFEQPLPSPWGEQRVYDKLRYIAYEDDRFEKRVNQPVSQGILGPSLRAVVGDTIEVVFLNRTDRPLSMHPHGVRYEQDHEGAAHGSHLHGVAEPGERITYEWTVDENAGPAPNEPSSRAWLYHSHVNAEDDIYRGLVGSIVVTRADQANEDATPKDIEREFTTLFLVFNENAEDTPEEEQEGNLKHAINGRIFANLKGLEMERGERVRFHLLALGTEVDLHTAHFHGETVTDESGHSTDVIELLPASMRTVDMIPDNEGEWMFHCHVGDHVTAGMYAKYIVR